MKTRRALISVYDKKGVLPFSKALHALKFEIISTGGTAELLRKENIPVRYLRSVDFPIVYDLGIYLEARAMHLLHY